MADIPITSHLSINEAELDERFVHASGPGGQNVNKVATAVELRFDVTRSPSLPHDVRVRLIRLAGNRITKDGVLLLDGRRFRTQERNRADVRARLVDLIRRAATPPKPRRATKPSLASKKRVQEGTRRHSALKRLRRSAPDD
jgi:ribosome-associated protein